jgi:hypothetical protein
MSSELRMPPPMYWIPCDRSPNALGEALGGIVLARLDGDGWVNVETGERFFADPSGFSDAVILSGFSEAVSEGSHE